MCAMIAKLRMREVSVMAGVIASPLRPRKGFGLSTSDDHVGRLRNRSKAGRLTAADGEPVRSDAELVETRARLELGPQPVRKPATPGPRLGRVLGVAELDRDLALARGSAAYHVFE